MTISELAGFITRKLQKQDATSVQFCKDAIRNRWQIVWESRLWRQSMPPTPVTMPVAAGTTLLTIDASIDRVVALRFGPHTTLVPDNWESLFREDPSWYERVGAPLGFIQAGRNANGQVMIKLTSIPNVSDTLLVIGKMAFPACANDTDSPSQYLDGVSGVLLAFGEGDMLERQERRQAALSKFTEATALMATMESLQNEQSAQNFQMSPNTVEIYPYEW